ncbi:MAG: GTPase HflX [Planctomycetaceae bacterium]|nr:GTPase HflX [Planctomycetaceae bacterium]
MKSSEKTVYQERALLVGTVEPGFDLRSLDPLDELTRLAETAGAVVVDRLVQKRERPDPRTYIGSGKAGELSRRVADAKIDTVIFDNELSPGQITNLEKDIGCKVIDRTELILDIFATHARTYQAKLQVELAQLEYTLPRISKLGAHITSEQQAGGGAGIGMRGPGEKQIESDRRLARKRIVDLRREMKKVEDRKRREVSARTVENTTVSLVGYTNAGKSTLMNALTKAGVLVEDKLFSTLDTRTRIWILDGGIKVLLSDTVGFIRNLPHDLVASFHATLEEVAQADLLLHVVDAGHPQAAEHIAAVESVLKILECSDKPTLLVFNKVDRFRDPIEREILLHQHPEAIALSARTGEGIDVLTGRVAERLTRRLIDVDVEIPQSEGKLLAELSTWSVPLKREYVDSCVRMTLRVPARALYKLERFRVESKVNARGRKRSGPAAE